MDREPVTVRSYANIAIIKYWGKKKKKIWCLLLAVFL